jgi:hypothetical protein
MTFDAITQLGMMTQEGDTEVVQVLGNINKEEQKFCPVHTIRVG